MDELLLDIILYGSDKYNDTVNKEILLHTISFIKNTKCFERPGYHGPRPKVQNA